MSKNAALLFDPSLEAPTAPSPEISRVSAPLNIFRIRNEVLNERPTVCILLCERSMSKPKPYFLRGDNLIFAVNVVSDFVNCVIDRWVFKYL